MGLHIKSMSDKILINSNKIGKCYLILKLCVYVSFGSIDLAFMYLTSN